MALCCVHGEGVCVWGGAGRWTTPLDRGDSEGRGGGGAEIWVVLQDGKTGTEVDLGGVVTSFPACLEVGNQVCGSG